MEYRAINAYWSTRLAAYRAPFLLRLINGMSHPIPEVTAVVTRVRKNTRRGEFELHLGRLRGLQHWDRRRRRPC